MSTEIELKLEVDPDDLAIVRSDPLFAQSHCSSNQQVTVYYDTPATTLKKHGFTLRVRSADGRFVQTVKPITAGVGLMSREEIECELSSPTPDLSSPLFEIIRTLFDGNETDELKEVVRSDVMRTSWHIDQGNSCIQVDLDHGTISAGERRADFAEMELELVDGPAVCLIVAAQRLSDRVPLRLGVLTKSERGFLLADHTLGKVSKAAPVRVTPNMTVAEAFEVIVHACLKQYRLNEPLVIRKSKAGALHQARVAMRRLRSALTLFRPAVADVEFQHLRHELRWFTDQLGDARNLDVYLGRDREDETRAELMFKRERAYEQVAEAMNSQKFRRLLIELVGWTALGSWRSGKRSSRPAVTFATRRLRRLWESILAPGRDIGAMDELARHDLRIRIKKLRYAAEFLHGLYPHAWSSQRSFAVAIEELQESLGKLNDMAIAKTLETASVDEEWLIGSPEERRYVKLAERSLGDLMRAGPFWNVQENEKGEGAVLSF